MKVKDILEKTEITEDDCDLCKLHDYMYTSDQKMKCPSCGCDLYFTPDDDITPVGETNGPDDDEEIKMMPVIKCKCGEAIALYPTKIIWNANHDVYYSGGKSYMAGRDIQEVIGDRLLPSIEQYHRRVISGENLQPLNLNIWIKYEIESCLAEYLLKKGLKK